VFRQGGPLCDQCRYWSDSRCNGEADGQNGTGKGGKGSGDVGADCICHFTFLSVAWLMPGLGNKGSDGGDCRSNAGTNGDEGANYSCEQCGGLVTGCLGHYKIPFFVQLSGSFQRYQSTSTDRANLIKNNKNNIIAMYQFMIKEFTILNIRKIHQLIDSVICQYRALDL
jgi:hypothetical protein